MYSMIFGDVFYWGKFWGVFYWGEVLGIFFSFFCSEVEFWGGVLAEFWGGVLA